MFITNFNHVQCVKVVVTFRGGHVDISKDFLKELKLESGSTYSFGVSDGKPLTFKNVSYKPFKLIMENVKKGPVIFKGNAFNNYEFPFLDLFVNDISIGEEGEVVKYTDILYICIWSLVYQSDIIQGNIRNRQNIEYAEVYSDSYLKDPVYDVLNISLTCTKIIKDDLSIKESK